MNTFSNSPYTYFIMWTASKMKYYGCQYGKTANPQNILSHKYKTSSKYVSRYWSEYGAPDVIKIHRTFNNISECRQFEQVYLRRVDAVKRPDWINKTDNRSIAPECSGGAKAAAVSAKVRRHLLETDIEYKEKLRQLAIRNFQTESAMKARKKTFQEIGHSRGQKNPRYGAIIKGTETARKISDARKKQTEFNIKQAENLNVKDKVCEHCSKSNLSWGNYKRWHHDNCRKRIKQISPHSTPCVRF